MPPVKSTPTIIDLQAEALRLKNNISAIKVEQENENRNLSTILSAVDETLERKKTIEEYISNIESSTLLLIDSANELIGDIYRLFEIKKDLLDSFDSIISKINSFIESNESKISEAVKRYDSIHESIIKEQSEISHKMRDLNIYKKRIEEKASELGIKIIV